MRILKLGANVPAKQLWIGRCNLCWSILEAETKELGRTWREPGVTRGLGVCEACGHNARFVTKERWGWESEQKEKE